MLALVLALVLLSLPRRHCRQEHHRFSLHLGVVLGLWKVSQMLSLTSFNLPVLLLNPRPPVRPKSTILCPRTPRPHRRLTAIHPERTSQGSCFAVSTGKRRRVAQNEIIHQHIDTNNSLNSCIFIIATVVELSLELNGSQDLLRYGLVIGTATCRALEA